MAALGIFQQFKLLLHTHTDSAALANSGILSHDFSNAFSGFLPSGGANLLADIAADPDPAQKSAAVPALR